MIKSSCNFFFFRQEKAENYLKTKQNKKSGALQKKKESGIICNLTVANGSLHVPIFFKVVDNF